MAICQREKAVHKWSFKKNSIAKIENCISFEIYIHKKVEIALYLNDWRQKKKPPNDKKITENKQKTEKIVRKLKNKVRKQKNDLWSISNLVLVTSIYRNQFANKNDLQHVVRLNVFGALFFLPIHINIINNWILILMLRSGFKCCFSSFLSLQPKRIFNDYNNIASFFSRKYSNRSNPFHTAPTT